MASKALLDRLARLEKQKQTAYKPVTLLFGTFAVYAVAAKAGKRAKGTVLERYARVARYRNVTELLDVARNDPATFARKHLRQNPPWREPAHVEDARRCVLAWTVPDPGAVAEAAQRPMAAVLLAKARRASERMAEAQRAVERV
jgi:hypothetical protein